MFTDVELLLTQTACHLQQFLGIIVSNDILYIHGFSHHTNPLLVQLGIHLNSFRKPISLRSFTQTFTYMKFLHILPNCFCCFQLTISNYPSPSTDFFIDGKDPIPRSILLHHNWLNMVKSTPRYDCQCQVITIATIFYEKNISRN